MKINLKSILISFAKFILLSLIPLIFSISLFNIIFNSTTLPYFEMESVSNVLVGAVDVNCTSICSFDNCMATCMEIANETEICKFVCNDTSGCEASCLAHLENATKEIKNSVGVIYNSSIIYNYSFNDMLSFQKSLFYPSVLLLIVSGVLLFLLSKKKLRVFYVNILIIAALFIILGFIPELLLRMYAPQEMDIEQFKVVDALFKHFQEAFNACAQYGIYLLELGLLLITIEMILHLRKEKMRIERSMR